MSDAPLVPDGVALLTLALHGDDASLGRLVDDLVEEHQARDLVLALVALARGLCFTTARMVHAVDRGLPTTEAVDLRDDEVVETAVEVLRAVGRRAARATPSDQQD